MHELEDRSHSQIGRVLGVSAGASKALVCRARQGVAQAVGRRRGRVVADVGARLPHSGPV